MVLVGSHVMLVVAHLALACLCAALCLVAARGGDRAGALAAAAVGVLSLGWLLTRAVFGPLDWRAGTVVALAQLAPALAYTYVVVVTRAGRNRP